MKKLYLQIISEGVHSFGFDLVWNNPDFLFQDFSDKEIFDQFNCALQNGNQGRLLISGSNLSQRHISGTHELCEIHFGWNEGASDTEVPFKIENLSAKNMSGNDISISVEAVKYDPKYMVVIRMVWR